MTRSELRYQLAVYGIVCVTPENLRSPWLNYEAGALAEQLNGRTCPYLLREATALLVNTPLARLTAKRATKEGTREVVKAINAHLDQPLKEAGLEELFETVWGELDAALDKIPNADNVHQRTDSEKIEEILALARLAAAQASTELGMIQASRLPAATKLKRRFEKYLEEHGALRGSYTVSVRPQSATELALEVFAEYADLCKCWVLSDETTDVTLRTFADQAITQLGLDKAQS